MTRLVTEPSRRLAEISVTAVGYSRLGPAAGLVEVQDASACGLLSPGGL